MLCISSVVANRKRVKNLQFMFTIRWFQYLLTCFNISVDTEVRAVFSVKNKHMLICENDTTSFEYDMLTLKHITVDFRFSPCIIAITFISRLNALDYTKLRG